MKGRYRKEQNDRGSSQRITKKNYVGRIGPRSRKPYVKLTKKTLRLYLTNCFLHSNQLNNADSSVFPIKGLNDVNWTWIAKLSHEIGT